MIDYTYATMGQLNDVDKLKEHTSPKPRKRGVTRCQIQVTGGLDPRRRLDPGIRGFGVQMSDECIQAHCGSGSRGQMGGWIQLYGHVVGLNPRAPEPDPGD
ncbi:unnamed protein product [Phytophthora fragariaefolia]|uniref:Unnamed protein product n=1 Tax=Phytophthora fragariaefolia TaxID=1490495 RepID=A0A9W6U7H9_9STRA|nr:unnamed protein product [Phytophthora fragariaefolia]